MDTVVAVCVAFDRDFRLLPQSPAPDDKGPLALSLRVLPPLLLLLLVLMLLLLPFLVPLLLFLLLLLLPLPPAAVGMD